jgi:glycosyltransferase involved in cell wall biosynthesis
VRILLVHNHYQKRGGEDFVFEAERKLLEGEGHHVFVYERHNDEIKLYSAWQRASLPRRAIWATDSIGAIRQILLGEKPDIAHFYNTFPLISPAAYFACSSAGVPVVQTLPNYRLICPGATLQRNGQTCELCVGSRVPWSAVLHRCYRGSWLQSSVVTAMLMFHRAAGTWDKHVNTYIALTEFARRKLIQGGLPGHKIVVKPNFVHPDPCPRVSDSGYALFVGRLSKEKGIETLLRAWRSVPEIPLKIAGDGPMRSMVEEAARQATGARIEPLGWRSRQEILGLMKGASFLVVPSEWYEGFPLTIVEALACGVPVIGSRLGSTEEIVQDGLSGLLFDPGNSADLLTTVRRVWSDTPLRKKLELGARSQFEARYTAGRNYEMIMRIFENAVAEEG